MMQKIYSRTIDHFTLSNKPEMLLVLKSASKESGKYSG